MRSNATLAERAAIFCRANHASLRDLPTENFWSAVRALPDQVARALVSSRLTAGLVVATPAMASATTYNVTSADDSGAGTLRDAITQANASAGADVITFDASLSDQTITIDSQLPQVTDPLTITGLGSAHLTIDGNSASRIFYLYARGHIDGGANFPQDVTITGLTLQHANSGIRRGGSILNRETNLTLDDVTIKDSHTTYNGGGIYSYRDGTLTIRNSTLSGNTARSGGGLMMYKPTADVLIDNVTFSGNTVTEGGGAVYLYRGGAAQITIQNATISGNQSTNGGGVGVYGSSATVNIVSSTLSNNIATATGAGFSAKSTTGTVTIDQTTIAANHATREGGGISAYNVAELNVTNTTISGNSSNGNGGGAFFIGTHGRIENCTVTANSCPGSGGGVYLYGGDVPIRETTISGNSAVGAAGGLYARGSPTGGAVVVNSIIAGNTYGVGDAGLDTATDNGGMLNVSFSLIQFPGVAFFAADAGPVIGDDAGIPGLGNIDGQDPLLGALADNGGPTKTMFPGVGSPAVNAGDPSFASPPSTDQRGVGYARVFGAHIDMGAVEVQPPPHVDAGSDAGSNSDGGSNSDAGSNSDGGTIAGNDAGGGSTSATDGGSGSSKKAGCACSGADADVALALLAPIGALLLRRRRARV